MKLTNQQVATIEQTLVLNGVVYEDIKLEIIDHIASEIEENPNSDVKNFEIILKEVFEKWKPQLKPASYGLWAGRGYSGPKIIMDKMASYTKSMFLYILLISIPFTLLAIGLMRVFNSELVIAFFSKGIRLLYLIEIFLVVAAWLFILQSKKKTTFSYLFEKRSILIFFQPLLIGIGFSPLKLLQNNLNIQLAFTYFLFALALYFMLDFKLVYNHFKTIKRLSISNL